MLPLKAATVRRGAMRQLEDLPGWANTVIGDLLSEVSRLDERIAQYDRLIQSIAKQSEPALQLMRLAGVGPTTATALVAMIGRGGGADPRRQFQAAGLNQAVHIFPPRDAQALMSEGLDLRGVCMFISRRL